MKRHVQTYIMESVKKPSPLPVLLGAFALTSIDGVILARLELPALQTLTVMALAIASAILGAAAAIIIRRGPVK